MAPARAVGPLPLVTLAAAALLLGACSHAPRTAVAPYGPAETSGPPAPAAASAPASSAGREAAPAPDDSEAAGGETGNASFYAASFEGRRTANGDLYSGQALTAAHRTLPFGTHVRVTNLRNGKSVEVVINDRGPHRRGRVIDLSRRAARAIDLVQDGVAPVRLEVVDLAVGELH